MDLSNAKLFLGGYSLAGLFSLWSGYKTVFFSGIAAVSPSVWFEGWRDFISENELKTNFLYLSLGNKEHKTKNPLLRTVKDNIVFQQEIAKSQGVDCMLEFNEGNHFQNPALRTANGFSRLIENG